MISDSECYYKIYIGKKDTISKEYMSTAVRLGNGLRQLSLGAQELINLRYLI